LQRRRAMDKLLVLASLLMAGCACEPIDTSGCAAAFDEPCQEYTLEGASCAPWRTVCGYSPCRCGDDYVVTCGADLSVPHDLGHPRFDLATEDDGGFGDGGFEDGG